ncbi:hypothetical protein UCDDS831_g08825 [Diplodia seriata]|uniref:Uncharacterized protein n=1 Tax=Diplodia seriata TaxID=420778 RepID=A0A0G2FNT7_9PEZI|nr:hypothetical protein UCDDS831_g08825 [Diplodia seriata]
MFSADLSWTDQRAETVGQRRERRLRSHRDHGSSTQSFQSDDSASRSSFWSLPVRRKNNPSKSPALNSPSRKSSKLSLSRPREDSLDSAASWSTPAPLPTPVLPALPSIASVDTVQEQRSPRHSTTRSSGKRERRIVEEVEAHEIQQLSQDSYVSRTTTRSTEIHPAPFPSPIADADQTSSSTHGRSAYRTSPDVGPKCTWEAPADWDIASIRSFSQNRQSFESSFLCDPDAAELTQFQRFVRRMERADPKLILTRLKDEPSPDDLATDPYAEEELAVEKHLWCLTALQLQNMENSLVPNQGVGPLLGLPTLFRQPKRVLELYSNLAEVYQLSAIYPKSHISYLTVRKPLASIPLPANIHPLTKASMQDGTKRSTLDYNKRNAMTGSGTEAMDFAAPVENSTGQDSDSTALDGELATLVVRGLWKDSWGSLVDRGSTLGHDVIWWWDDPEIVRECWDYGTVFECGTMFAFKE